MNVDWIALQDRLTAAEAALKVAEKDVETLTAIVSNHRYAIFDFARSPNSGISVSLLYTLDMLARVSLRPEIMDKINRLRVYYDEIKATL